MSSCDITKEKVRVCVCAPLALFSDSTDEEKATERVSQRFGEAQRSRILAKKNRQDRLLSLGGLEALGKIVGQECARLSRAELGKPFFADKTLGGLSISHSWEISVAACGPCEIGVDIENIGRDLDFQKLSDRFFSKAERDRLISDGMTAESFYKIWTSKEAYVKYTGEGIGGLRATDGIADVIFKRFFVEYNGERYIMSLCTPNDIETEIIVMNGDVAVYEIQSRT